MTRPRSCWAFSAALVLSSAHGRAATPIEKVVFADGVPATREQFNVSSDGRFSYFASNSFFEVFDAKGDHRSRISLSGVARSLVPLKNGDFVSAQSHGAGRITRVDASGKELRTLVIRGSTPEHLRADQTAWSSPTGIAVDQLHRLIFALDLTEAKKGTPSPDWSRIAVFDLDGKYQRSIALYDGSASAPRDELRTWYDDIALDPKRQRVYVTARRSQEFRAFNYDGSARGKAPGIGGVATLPNGNIAVGDPNRQQVRIYDPELHLLRALALKNVRDLATDSAGRLYASTDDPTVLFVRWSPQLSRFDVVHPRFSKISVDLPVDSVTAGTPFSFAVRALGDAAKAPAEWHVFSHPADGSSLDWRELPSELSAGTLTVSPPRDVVGFNDLAVRFGAGAISYACPADDLHVEKTLLFAGAAGSGRVGVRTVDGRSAFQRGEVIPFRIERQGSGSLVEAPATLTLYRGELALGSQRVSSEQKYWQLSAALTERLFPGHYRLVPSANGLRSDALDFDIAESKASSSLQRILYHEFDMNMRGADTHNPESLAQRLENVNAYVDGVANLGFSRETDRAAQTFMNVDDGGAWRQDAIASTAAHDSLPLSGVWEPGYYLDRATARGLHYDAQLLSHCASVRVASSWFPPLDASLQRMTQWLGRYPAFYGFNYNDEMFFPQTGDDADWVTATTEQLANHSRPDALRLALTRMYGEFDRSVQAIRPDLARTATPMWQFPAVEGSYAPTIYRHMTESYTHYLSEGYGWPFYPAHSAEFLRRPGLPLMAVVDNGYHSGYGESYAKDAMQVLGRGVQGIGLEHNEPFKDARGADALHVVNELAEQYGSLLATAPPKNEGAILYSYTQDVTERRDWFGTPHWERVLALHGAGLMAGLPLTILYEEDLANGALLERGKPKVPLLFLAGQTAALPSAVSAALSAFRKAGGHVVEDRDSTQWAGDWHAPLDLLSPLQAARPGFDTDGLFPLAQPAYEALAQVLSSQFGAQRAFAVDSDDPWVAKNHFDGGAIQYVLVAGETRPYPWDAGSTWSLGARYNQSSWPRQVQLTMPASPVIYDVFERARVDAQRSGNRATISADLRTFPARLYALAPSQLGAPQLQVDLRPTEVEVRVNVGLRAMVPLRITLRLSNGDESNFYRSTTRQGSYAETFPRPLGEAGWRIVASELLSGKSSESRVPGDPLAVSLCSPQPAVDVEREPQLRSLLQTRGGKVQLARHTADIPAELEARLVAELRRKGMLVTTTALNTPTTSGSVHLTLSTLAGREASATVSRINRSRLLNHPLGANYPGPARGFLGAAFSALQDGERDALVVGGDSAGLALATERLIQLLRDPVSVHTPPPSPPQRPVTLSASAHQSLETPVLAEMTGVRLSGVRAFEGKLVVSAHGQLGNLARVDDEGSSARVVSALRVGDAPESTSLFVGREGKSFGLATRSLARFGEAFFMSNEAATSTDAFASFGDAAPFQHDFSVSADATSVLAPGPYGVVAWHRSNSGWREAWAIDYWRKYKSLDWSLANDKPRIPDFETLIPRAGDLGLVTFSEFTSSPHLSAQQASAIEVSARSLRDGSERWRFSPPLSGSAVFPKLYAGSSGAVVVLEAHSQSVGPTHYFVLENGHLRSTFRTEVPASNCEISERGKLIALALGDGSRVLELRSTSGSVSFSKVWHAQPRSIVFAEDGTSLYVSDDAGRLSRVDKNGQIIWQRELGCSAQLAQDGQSLYAAGWDGHLRAFTPSGSERWHLDLTGPLEHAVSQPAPALAVHSAERASTASTDVPAGPNLLRTGKATLRVGGTPGWKSQGTLTINPRELTNGLFDDAKTGWIPTGELFSDGTAFRKAWVELDFATPTYVHALTVRENPDFAQSWPDGSLIQEWDDAKQRWRTAARGLFLRGPSNTYVLNLAHVSKLRYVPWGSYFRNFHTSEIEVR